MPILLRIEQARAVGDDVDQSFGPGGVVRMRAVYEDRKDRSVTIVYTIDERVESMLPDLAKETLSLVAEVGIALTTECPIDRVSVGWSR